MPIIIRDMHSKFQNAFTLKNYSFILGRAICLDKALLTTPC